MNGKGVGHGVMEQRVEVMGTGFDPVTLEEAAKRIAEWVDGWNGAGPLKQVVTANPEVVMLARRNPGVAQVVRRADLVTADGIGVVLASKWLGTPVPERVTGADLADRLLGFAGQRRWRVYLLGASSASLGGALAELRRHYPEVDWHGHHGYFDQQGEKEILQEIAEVRPHLLFVGMGAPRQDLWIARHRDLPVGVAMGIGGTIDVWSGAVKRAPVAWQRFHLEWLYRLIRQPSRIRRQMVLPHFALLALGAALTMRRRGGPGPK